MSKWVENQDSVIETDEFELHNVIATLYHLEFAANKQNQPVHKVTIKPKGYEAAIGGTWVDKEKKVHHEGPFEHIEMSKSEARKLELAVNELIKHMHKVDRLLHKVAGYTC